jgi:hypothetical protein
MNLFVLLNLAIPFLTLEVTENGGEKVRINVPKAFAEEALLSEELCDEAWEKGGKKIPRDSILKILREAETSSEPVMEITEGENIIRLWIKNSEDIIKATGTPKKLIINVQSDKEEDNVNIKLPLTFVKVLPFFIPELGEDAEDTRIAKALLKEAIKHIQNVEGSFILAEVESNCENVKISVE